MPLQFLAVGFTVLVLGWSLLWAQHLQFLLRPLCDIPSIVCYVCNGVLCLSLGSENSNQDVAS